MSVISMDWNKTWCNSFSHQQRWGLDLISSQKQSKRLELSEMYADLAA